MFHCSERCRVGVNGCSSILQHYLPPKILLTNQFDEIAAKIHQRTAWKVIYLTVLAVEDSLLNYDEIRIAIARLKNNKAAGSYGLAQSYSNMEVMI